MNLDEKMIYSAPEMKAYEVEIHKVLCDSGETEDYVEGNTSEWYN